jgi:hypothetical protein
MGLGLNRIVVQALADFQITTKVAAITADIRFSVSSKFGWLLQKFRASRPSLGEC